MRKSYWMLIPAIAAPLLLDGCQTWGPTWSEVTGQRYNMTITNRRPAIIDMVDNQGSFPDPRLIGSARRASPRRAGTRAGLAGRSAAARHDAERRALQAVLHQRAVRHHDHAAVDAGHRLRRADRRMPGAGGQVAERRVTLRRGRGAAARRRGPARRVPDAPRHAGRGARRVVHDRARRSAGRGRRIGRGQVADRRRDHRTHRPARAHRRRQRAPRGPSHRQPAVRRDASSCAAARSARCSRIR